MQYWYAACVRYTVYTCITPPCCCHPSSIMRYFTQINVHQVLLKYNIFIKLYIYLLELFGQQTFPPTGAILRSQRSCVLFNKKASYDFSGFCLRIKKGLVAFLTTVYTSTRSTTMGIVPTFYHSNIPYLGPFRPNRCKPMVLSFSVRTQQPD